jgi:hypothetical protein
MRIPVKELKSLLEHKETCLLDGTADIELQPTISEVDYVSSEQFLTCYRNFMSASGDESFGLHFGCFLNIRALGFVTFVQKSAHRFEQAVKFIQDYLDESFPLVSLKINDEPDKLQLILSSNIHDDDELSGHVLDTVFAFIYREIKLLLPSDIPYKAILPYKSLGEYERLLKVKCQV